MHDTTKPLEAVKALRAVFELVPQGVFIVDANRGSIADVNPAACAALGMTRGELIGRPWVDVERCVPSPVSRSVDCDEGRLIIVTCAVAAESTSAAPRDALTGLANREALMARMAWDDPAAVPEGLGLLFIDLDGFKQVNDTFGHLVGDRVLKIVAQRLANSIRTSDLVVRFGGDEFVVIVEGVRRRRDLQRRARHIARAVERPIVLDGIEMALSASIGIAQRTARTATADALIAEADRAMYREKRLTRQAANNRFDPPMTAAAG